MSIGKDEHINQTWYEKRQEFNALVSWLHSFRYKNIVGVLDELARDVQGRPIRVIDIGCAHAKLFGVLNRRFHIDYIGIELYEGFYRAAKQRYALNANFRILNEDATSKEVLKSLPQPDVVVALETLEHIPGRDVVRLVEHISEIRPRFFICSVPVEIGPAIWLKNIGSLLIGYMRHKEYTWSETFWAGLYNLDKLPSHGGGHKGFDWRWLAQTVRHNMEIEKIRKFPFRYLPAALSTSVFIVAKPRAS